MGYEEFLLSVSQHDKFEIVEEKYEEAFFGNFQTNLLFVGELDLEIINDRGILDIFINHSGAFKKHQIPLWFAIECMKADSTKEPQILDSLMKAQEYLFNHVPLLLTIVEKNVLGDIARRWRKRRT